MHRRPYNRSINKLDLNLVPLQYVAMMEREHEHNFPPYFITVKDIIQT